MLVLMEDAAKNRRWSIMSSFIKMGFVCHFVFMVRAKDTVVTSLSILLRENLVHLSHPSVAMCVYFYCVLWSDT